MRCRRSSVLPAERMLKTILYDAGGRTVAVLVPGDREVEEAKLERVLFPDAGASVRRGRLPRSGGSSSGYVGPQGLDRETTFSPTTPFAAALDWVTGANEADHHVTARTRRATSGSTVRGSRRDPRRRPLPVDGGQLHIGRSIVVGHIYQLGHDVLGPLGGDVRRRGRYANRPFQMGSLWDRHLAHPGRGRRAVPRRPGPALAEGPRAVRGRGDQREHRRRARRRPRRSGSTTSCRRAASTSWWTTAANAPG